MLKYRQTIKWMSCICILYILQAVFETTDYGKEISLRAPYGLTWLWVFQEVFHDQKHHQV